MSQIDNGGSAFPAEVYLTPQDTMATKCPGMSLRDYLAAQALQGYLAGKNNNLLPTNHEARMVACDCYRYADAMLAARLTKPE